MCRRFWLKANLDADSYHCFLFYRRGRQLLEAGQRQEFANRPARSTKFPLLTSLRRSTFELVVLGL